MGRITLRPQRISDAKCLYEILNSDKFLYTARPKSLEAEKRYLQKNAAWRRKNLRHNFTILSNGKVVGGCGIKVDAHRHHIGEEGYFVDENYWGKGIATAALQLLERIGFKTLGLVRLEIVVNPKNAASIRVARKCGFKQEGRLRKKLHCRGRYDDALIFGKTR